jgi:hypothetical protein
MIILVVVLPCYVATQRHYGRLFDSCRTSPYSSPLQGLAVKIVNKDEVHENRARADVKGEIVRLVRSQQNQTKLSLATPFLRESLIKRFHELFDRVQ